jgi:hypothetical protein
VIVSLSVIFSGSLLLIAGEKSWAWPRMPIPYKYYDLDWIVTVPNCDPHIKNFEMIKDTDDEPGGSDRLRSRGSSQEGCSDALFRIVRNRHHRENAGFQI